MDYTALGQAIQAAKAAWGVVPSAELLQLAAQASTPFGVPLDIFVAFMRNESSLKTKGVFRQEKGSYKRWKDKKAPGSDKTWGQLYTEAEWGSYGPMQLMVFNFVGTPGGLTPGEPLSKGHDTLFNFSQAARLIRDLYKKHSGRWKDVFSAYNSNYAFGKVTSSMFYTLHVATYLKAIGVGGILDDGDVAALKAKIAKERGSKAPSPAGTKWAKLQQWEKWQGDLDKYLALSAPGAVAATVQVGAEDDSEPQNDAPYDAADELRDALQVAYLARDLDRVAELQDELALLADADATADTTDITGAENGERTA